MFEFLYYNGSLCAIVLGTFHVCPARKDILKNENLSENKLNTYIEVPSIEETHIRLDIESRNVELQDVSPEISTKPLDEMSVRINLWLTQLLKYRKFNRN